MNKKLRIVILILFIVNLVFSSLSVFHGEINQHTDIARDYLLLNEMQHKIFVLIGPRASTEGLFHGPLWNYVNLIPYTLSNGDPVIIGWWWIVLIILFLISSFFIVKKLFGEEVAYLYLLLMSTRTVIMANSLFNPSGALFMMPFFFYSIIRYMQTKMAKYLLIHLFITGLIVQFQMAVGLPLLILSVLYIGHSIIRGKKYKHIYSFLILLLPISTYILFDIRHNFSQFSAIVNSLTGKTEIARLDYFTMIVQRIDIMTRSGMEIFKAPYDIFNILLGYLLVTLLVKQIHSGSINNRAIYFSGLYYYVGFFIVSLMHNGYLLHHFWLPLTALTFMIFVSCFKLMNKKYFTLIFLCVYLLNFYQASSEVLRWDKNSRGKNENSWSFQKNISSTIFKDADQDFGIYIYSPDTFAYQIKAGVLYGIKNNPQKKVSINQKKRLTYIIVAPVPKLRPDLEPPWWIANRVKISALPVKTFEFQEGYKVLKYELNSDQQKIPSDSILDDWITMR
ncbi:hypothetical protein A3C23_02940 [Candidatus Roizmanbacteria bacterium RIFCSPHIGHO2_02_FULL_37_13b]|uniref:Glycosyltransferase RgtA/B/C/D-like domain-containing protein n=1 Tax=Candidatus Roizmanbacteria bacterium RIFCSPLOWO2_02_FULL_36_11 TaxID=1802071 RepID=A0A1F7JI77_9BACT|nr:MAG: hypothetical protein A3C23_02940 [Candidatus Roizmanbacteria bacterium RIFCSPHIGHO2_02_FULL_37_13b]OGK55309.1 MAG: hypothetical protein A3H78_04370 [Candidatus Roizmanbacteria bacterium RIFCSPLOWO2_02_FULL_36_11]